GSPHILPYDLTLTQNLSSLLILFFFFSSRRRHTRFDCDWSSDVCSSDLVYLQLHAYMFRIAIPYGQLSARKLRQLAMIADKFDKGYGHFTTRQNIQFNWIRLAEIPDALEALDRKSTRLNSSHSQISYAVF